MVAAGSLFLLCLYASSDHCRHGATDDGRRHATSSFGVNSSSSRSSGLRREVQNKSFLSAQSAGIEEGQIDDGGNIFTSDVRQLQWEEKYLLLKRFQEREGHCDAPRSHKEDGAPLGVWINTQRQLKRKEKLDPDRQKILEETGLDWGLTSATWEERFALLKQFKKREGHCKVPQSHEEDGATLGAWVSNQRQFKKKGKLDPERQKILEDIGFEWVLVKRGASVPWEEIVSLFKQYMKREGHCNVPQSHKEDGANLGAWVNAQRQYKKKEKLDPDRQKILEDIGFEWAISATWERRFSLLKQFIKREGHYKVPLSHEEDGAKNLGAWVHTQRQLVRNEKINPDRRKSLEEIGIDWMTSATWEESFALLKQFIKREGHCNVPQSHKEDGANLGAWVNAQRQLERNEKINPDRRMSLVEIGFEWVTSAPWEERFALLKQFEKREGHCNVPQSHEEDGANLGAWVNTQRQLERNEKINPDRQKILEEIGFEWATLATWDENLALLKQYKKREGHCNVPVRHTEDGAKLGRWVLNRRQSKKKGKLDPDRQKILEEIGIEWVLVERRANVPWEEMLSSLKQFKKREGHCNAPRSHKEDGASLGVWVHNQRKLKRNEKINPDRQKILEEIGIVWVLRLKRASL